MIRQWLIGMLVMGLLPVGELSARGPLPAPVPEQEAVQPAPAMPVPTVTFKQEEPKAETEKQLADVMEKELLKFVESNYPSRLNFVVRNLQGEESPLRKDLNEAVRFLQGFTPGPVTVEGDWQGRGSRRRYALQSVVHGVTGSPQSTVIFHTYAGFFRPFTIVEVDKDGNGKKIEKSTALCKRETMLEWLSERFPQAVCLARKK